MAVTTNISFHLITSIEAVDAPGYGDPLILRLKSRYGDTDLTLFFDTGDKGIGTRLKQAINAAIVGPIEPPPENAHEAEARAKGWVTDEEMHPGTGPYHGVVHPEGWWAPDWKAACERSLCPHEAAAYDAAAVVYGFQGSLR